MKKFNYFYDGRAISKSQFISNVPENWVYEVEDGEYSYGSYKAIQID